MEQEPQAPRAQQGQQAKLALQVLLVPWVVQGRVALRVLLATLEHQGQQEPRETLEQQAVRELQVRKAP